MRDGLQNVQQLAFVFVNPLDLHVKQRVRADHQPRLLLDPGRQRHLVGTLGQMELGPKATVPNMRLQVAQPVQIVFPILANRRGDQIRQRAVAHFQPAARRHTIGLVHDPVRMQLVQFGEQVGLDQIGMQRRNTVDLMRHDKGQLAHPHLVMLDDADVMRSRGVFRPVPIVDPLDDLHVARQDIAKGKGRPPLQRLGQQSVVGIAQTGPRRLDGGGKLHPVIVGQQTHQFRPGNRRMGVVHLDRHVFRQGRHIAMGNLETAQNVLQGRRSQEKLLLQTQFLALIGRIVGVQHPAQRARQCLRLCRRRIVAPVEPFQIEQCRGPRRPQPQRVGPLPLPPDHRRIKRRGIDGFRRHPLFAAIHRLDIALEPDRIGAFGPLEFPRIAVLQPILGHFRLLTAREMLAKQPVFIADAIAVSRAAHRRHAFHETGRQPSQTAIAQGGIGLILDNGPKVLTQARHHLDGNIAQTQIDRGIFQQPPDQEFHRQIVDPLAIFGPCPAGRGEPRLDDPVANRKTQRHAPVIGAGIDVVFAQRLFQMAQNVILQMRMCQGEVAQCHVHR